jgi:predicted permease
MNKINEQFLLSLTIIFFGYLLKRVKILKKEDAEGLSRLVLNVTLPCLILVTISEIELNHTFITLPFICFGFGLISLLLGFIIFPKGSGTEKERGIQIMGLLGFNIGLFAYPLIEGIFGIPGLQAIAMVDLGNAFVIFGLMFLIGIFFSKESDVGQPNSSNNPAISNKSQQPSFSNNSQHPSFSNNSQQTTASNTLHHPDAATTLSQTPKYGKIILKRFLTNLPLIAYIISIIFAASQFRIPEFPKTIFSIIAQCNRGLVLLMIGLTMNVDFDKKYWKPIFKILITRYTLGISLGILLYFILPFEPFFKGILLISLDRKSVV